MSDHYNTYIGARYVPIFDGDWDNTKSYEPLVIVSYQGDSYTSKTYVPSGAPITNTTYWAKTGNYNAQVEQLSNHVVQLDNKVNEFEYDITDFREAIEGYDSQFTTINDHLTTLDGKCDQLDSDISNAVNTLNSRINSEVATLNTTISGNVSNITSALSGLSDHVDSEVQRLETEINGIEVSGGFVTPEMYGAVGDGTTDDTAALNACFLDAGRKHLIVRGSGKNYRVGSSVETKEGFTGVNVPYGVTMIGMKFFLSDDAPEKSTILTCGLNSEGVFRFIDCRFYMTGNGYDTTHTADSNGYHAILFIDQNLNNRVFLRNIKNIYFENCEFSNIFGYSIYIPPVENNTVIKNCTFTPHDNGQGIVCYAQNTVIDGCSITPHNAPNTRPYLIYDHLTTLLVSEQNCNLLVKNCKADSATGLFAHSLLAGEIRYYNTFKFDNCYAFYNGFSIMTYDSIRFENGVEISNSLFLGENTFMGGNNGTAEILKISDSTIHSIDATGEKLIMDNVDFSNVTALLRDLYLSNCRTLSDYNGCINSPTVSRINIQNIYIDNLNVKNESQSQHVIKNVTFNKCFIDGINFDGVFVNNHIVDNAGVSRTNENLLVIKGFTYKGNADDAVAVNVHSVIVEYYGGGYITADDCVNFKKIANWFE